MVDPGRRSGPARRIVDPLLRFLHDEAAGGVALLVATAAALAWANAAGGGYEALWGHALDVGAGGRTLRLDLRHWINDALMAIFFFVVGLEIKRELVAGELRDRRAATLPALAALGGVALPALIFLAITAGGPESSGWAIPAATDIAFAVGVLALLGARVPPGAKLFLLTIAIVDDVAAILVIALFYAGELSLPWLVGALCGLACVVGLRRLGVARIAPYALLGAAVWVAVSESGVHPTIAGVALGLLTPAGEVGGRDVMAILEQRLHAVSAFAIVPLFALANAGVSLGGGALADAARSRVAWAVAVGLVVGKLLGITGATFVGVRLGFGRLPAGVRRGQVWGLAAVGGIGFTVSLFIAQLAYDDPATVDRAKVGIFAGSVVSGLLGSLLLAVLARRARRPAGPSSRPYA
jgi:NhaA family Na+:H+ antiporter